MEEFREFQEKIFKELILIKSDINEIKTSIAIFNATIKPDIEKHDKLLYGNGKKGLKDRLYAIEFKMAMVAILAGYIGSLIMRVM